MTNVKKLFRKRFPNVVEYVSIVFNSYSQIFFSTHRGFSLMILLVTFLDFYAGLFGLAAVLTSTIAGSLLGFNRFMLNKGFLGFNSLLVGLGLGAYYEPSVYLLIIIILASLFTLLISVTMQGVIGKYGLPYLSVPFILCLWSFMIATKSFHALEINERGIYILNELYAIGGKPLVDAYEFITTLKMPQALRAYFISLSAILFQYNVLSGFVISLGLLFFSRIAFSLSLIGFFLAYGFYALIGANIPNYDYSFFGFNYVLSSIAIGGFYLIPSRNAYLWMVLLIPFVAIIAISMNAVFSEFKLPIYALPFNMIVLLFLYSLKFREAYSSKLSEVYFQHNEPEKNLYIFLNNKVRFSYNSLVPIKLPFYGKWHVSQAEDGKYTHQGLYRYAWDFDILGKNGAQFKNSGDFPEDYYCYDKPVIAPEDGVVEEIFDGVEDNVIGQMNLKENWGNTVIIKHHNEVYSKVSHLKKDSIKVKKGETVKFGQILAHCGNSGRSPYPHLHFQIQAFPYIGSVTMDYPLNNYIKHRQNQENFELKTHTKPKKDEFVSNIEANPLMVSALNFIPGQRLEFTVKDGLKKDKVFWEVKVNEFNQSYLNCSETNAKAFFENDKNLFYFTYFEGSKHSALFIFFQALFKLQKGYYQNLKVVDNFPLYLTYPKLIRWPIDFISPFVVFIKSEYTLVCESIDNTLMPSKIVLSSKMVNYFFKKEINSKDFQIHIDRSGICNIETTIKDRKVVISR